MKQGILGRHARAIGLTLTTLGLALLGGAPASAALISTSSCDSAPLTQPFAPWGDLNLYKLVPGATFENGAPGWSLINGAAVTAGSEPFGATGLVGNASLDLPAGASAQSPFTCVNAAYPSLRFFARTNGLASTMLVQVVYTEPLVGEVVVPVGAIAVSGNWAPSLPMLTASAVTGLLDGGTAQVALRFTGLTGDSQIDDVFVDPRMMR
jgi:hypothetical protein